MIMLALLLYNPICRTQADAGIKVGVVRSGVPQSNALSIFFLNQFPLHVIQMLGETLPSHLPFSQSKRRVPLPHQNTGPKMTH